MAKNNQVIYDKSGLKLKNYLGVSTDDDNENSILTSLEYYDFSMLFTGDVGINGIDAVIKELPKNITVLKVPHHGADGGVDKEIIEYLNPKYSLISVGENRFGHPGLYTLELLKGTNILRTDIENAIRFVVKKDSYKVLTYNTQKRKFK